MFAWEEEKVVVVRVQRMQALMQVDPIAVEGSTDYRILKICQGIIPEEKQEIVFLETPYFGGRKPSQCAQLPRSSCSFARVQRRFFVR